WDLAGRKEPILLEGSSGIAHGVAFTPDGKTLVWCQGKLVRLWDVESRRERASLDGHTAEILALAVAPVGGLLASAGKDRTIQLWDAATGKSRGILKGHTGEVTSLSFSPDGKTLLSGSQDGMAKRWDVTSPAGGKESFVERISQGPVH